VSVFLSKDARLYVDSTIAGRHGALYIYTTNPSIL
jgi:hypothetical protein